MHRQKVKPFPLWLLLTWLCIHMEKQWISGFVLSLFKFINISGVGGGDSQTSLKQQL